MTPRFALQERIFQASKDLPAAGLCMHVGRGKSRVVIETAYHLFSRGKIDAVLVVAPNLLHRSFVTDQLPQWAIKGVPTAFTVVFDSTTANTAKVEKEIKRILFSNHGELKWFAISYDGVLTNRGKEIAEQYLKAFRCLIIFDESSRIKNPKAQRTKVCLKLARLAAYKRILNGTLISQSPMDVYTQIQALDPSFWAAYNFGSFAAFRSYFAILKRRQICRAGRQVYFDEITGFRHLDELARLLEKIIFVVNPSEDLELPDLIETVRTFELAPKQRHAYEQLKNELILQLDSNLITVQAAVVLLMRLAQISSGFITGSDGTEVSLGDNPRLDLLKELLADTTEQFVLFTRFNYTAARIQEFLGDKAARLDGSATEAERADILDRFKSGKVQHLITKNSVGGYGLNLQHASNMIHVEQTYSFGDKIQATARILRAGQTKTCYTTTLEASNTVDQHMTKVLGQKEGFSLALLRGLFSA